MLNLNIFSIIYFLIYSYLINSTESISLRFSNELRSSVLRQCDTPTLKNGQVRLRQRGKLIRYVCGPGFQLSGDRYAACQNGRWDIPVPICIKNGCAPLETRPNAIIALQNNEATAILFCKPGYQAAGSRFTYCDGKQWDRAIGTCRLTNIGAMKWCDFETESLCDWTSDFTHDFEWKRRNGISTTKQIRSGPKFDHTVMKPLEGHYMVAESAATNTGDRARLISPPYAADLSTDACFRLYYHMYGLLMGTLNVYMKPISITMENVLEDESYLLFEKRGTQKNLWKEAVFLLRQCNETFQIVIQATAGRTHLSDIAIDDVALLNGNECLLESQQTTTVQIEEAGGVYDIQSCVNRCSESPPTLPTLSSSIASLASGNLNVSAFAIEYSRITEEIITNGSGKGGILLHCDCFDGCEDLKTCCIDYKNICVFSSTDDNFDDTNVMSTSVSFTTMAVQPKPIIPLLATTIVPVEPPPQSPPTVPVSPIISTALSTKQPLTQLPSQKITSIPFIRNLPTEEQLPVQKLSPLVPQQIPIKALPTIKPKTPNNNNNVTKLIKINAPPPQGPPPPPPPVPASPSTNDSDDSDETADDESDENTNTNDNNYIGRKQQTEQIFSSGEMETDVDDAINIDTNNNINNNSNLNANNNNNNNKNTNVNDDETNDMINLNDKKDRTWVSSKQLNDARDDDHMAIISAAIKPSVHSTGHLSSAAASSSSSSLSAPMLTVIIFLSTIIIIVIVLIAYRKIYNNPITNYKAKYTKPKFKEMAAALISSSTSAAAAASRCGSSGGRGSNKQYYNDDNDDEFSEIRYLTADDQIDFNIEQKSMTPSASSSVHRSSSDYK